MANDEEAATAFDPKRRLCPDGSCVGLIGSDGRCSVCGRSAGQAAHGDDATEPPPSMTPAPDEELDAEVGQQEQRHEPGSTFDPHRRLCTDGTCIGVVGRDNRCAVCGRPA